MSGKLIPFPQPTQSTTQNTSLPRGAKLKAAASTMERIHLVRSSAQKDGRSVSTQQKAQKIVAEIRRLQNQGNVTEQPVMLTERSPQFWATLPLPAAAMDTPLSVARRLVHLLIAHPA